MTQPWIAFAIMVLGSVVAPSPCLFAQCAAGVATLHGNVKNLPSGTDADVLVVLKTPKGDFSKTAEVKAGQFHLDVNFSTLKSWSPFWGHNCSNVPSLVEVTVRCGDQVLIQQELKFADDFERRDSLNYSLKREMTFDVSKRDKASTSIGP
jgi:hypothetical protein